MTFWILRLSLVFFICGATLARANNPFLVETDAWTYDGAYYPFIPGYTVNVIRAGVPTGKFIPKPNSTPDLADATAQALGEFFTRSHAATEVSNNRIDQVRNRSASRMQTELSAQPPAASNPPSENAPRSSAPAATISWNEFSACARNALPRLKFVIHLHERRSTLTGERRDALDVTLGRALNSLEEIRATGGLICGKHLGNAQALPASDEILNIKILQSLSARQAGEKEQLLVALVAALHPEANGEARSLWQAYWDRLSIDAVFHDAALPSIENLQTEMITHLSAPHELRLEIGTSVLRLTGVEAKVRELTAAGQNAAKGILGL